MDLSSIIGYFGALVIGVVLGLIGGGGSILTVPIFVYIMGITTTLATAYSLFVVGAVALVGALRNAQKGMIDYRTGIVFATPALVAVYITRKFIIPIIPDVLFTIGNTEVSKSMGTMVFFSFIMLLASYSMIKGRKNASAEVIEKVTYHYPLIIAEGIAIGFLTGLVGAGGGFLIIPALVLLAKLPMKKAVATSLMIIAIKSLIGFIGDVENIELDWPFLLSFTALSIVGIFIGIYISQFVDGQKLKKGFGWFVLFMAIYLLLKEIFM